MKVIPIRSDGIYKKIMKAPSEKKNDIYRYEMMMPFEKKWACYSVPMKATTPNGYDVIMASCLQKSVRSAGEPISRHYRQMSSGVIVSYQ